MSAYSSRQNAAISHASSWSSTIRMRFFSLLEFIIPFVRPVLLRVSSKIPLSVLLVSRCRGISAKSEKSGGVIAALGSVGQLLAFKSPHGLQCSRGQTSIGGELDGFQGVALYYSWL